jgi:hypothetical protein
MWSGELSLSGRSSSINESLALAQNKTGLFTNLLNLSRTCRDTEINNNISTKIIKIQPRIKFDMNANMSINCARAKRKSRMKNPFYQTIYKERKRSIIICILF